MLKEGFMQTQESLTIVKDNRLLLEVLDTEGITRSYVINDEAAEIIQFLGSMTPVSIMVSQLSKKYESSYEDINKLIEDFFYILESEYGVSIKIENDFQEGNMVKIQYRDEIYPLGAFVELTDSCNLKCIHCYAGCDNQNAKYMSFEDFVKIADQLRAMNVRSLELSGGEITIHPNINDIIKYALSVDFDKIGLITNGTLITDDIVDLISANKDRFNIQIDLHGLTDEYLEWFMGAKNLLAPNMKIIEKVAKIAPYFRVATIITRKNLSQIEEIADWVYNCGARFYGVSLVIPIGRALESGNDDLFLNAEEMIRFNEIIVNINNKYPDFINIIDQTDSDKLNCGCFANNIAIQPNGDIKLCSMDSGDCFTTSIGNALTEPIDVLCKKHQQFTKKIVNLESPRPGNNVCDNCSYLSFCSRCLLRAFTMAKKIGNECQWAKTISPDIKKYVI